MPALLVLTPSSSVLSLSTGCMLGLGLVLTALCGTGQTDQHVHVTQTLDKLLSNLQDSNGQGRMQQEVQPTIYSGFSMIQFFYYPVLEVSEIFAGFFEKCALSC